MCHYCIAARSRTSKDPPVSVFMEKMEVGNLDPTFDLDTETLAQEYERNKGGHLTRPSALGEDPLSHNPNLLQERHRLFWPTVLRDIGSIADIFGHVSNHDYLSIRQSILLYLSMSDDLLQNAS